MGGGVKGTVHWQEAPNGARYVNLAHVCLLIHDFINQLIETGKPEKAAGAMAVYQALRQLDGQ